MKDGPIFKLLNTKTRYWPTQYKKIIDTFLVLCADKNYQGIDDVIQTGLNLVEMGFMPTYPDADQWSTTHHVESRIVNPKNTTAVNRSHPPIITMEQQTHVFDENIQKELLSEFELDSKIKSQEYSKFLAKPTRRL